MPIRIEVGYRASVPDPRGRAVLDTIRSFLAIQADGVRTFDVYLVDAELNDSEAERARDHVTDPVTQRSALDRLEPEPCDQVVEVGFRPGVTDAVGKSALALLEDMLGRPLGPQAAVYTSRLFFLQGVSAIEAQRIASELLANELIERFQVWSRQAYLASPTDRTVPAIRGSHTPQVGRIDLGGTDDELMQISRERILSLSLDEMKSIRDAFRAPTFCAARQEVGLGPEPTDAEL
ncbi:MAG: phosphoribosylformylglycinamidine synthase, partial [Deltaproteobacteria bacterium]|nr:phosphoribosylformylglycinamidine synthase [Deltaproteobacteria bacterium]